MKKSAFIITLALSLYNIALAERSPQLAATPKAPDAKALEAHSKKAGLEKLVIKGKNNQLSMDKDSKIFINSKPISMNDLDAILHEIGKSGSVSVRCDKHARPDLVATLLHKVRYSGVKTSN